MCKGEGIEKSNKRNSFGDIKMDVKETGFEEVG
jgi:hypothetical protein